MRALCITITCVPRIPACTQLLMNEGNVTEARSHLEAAAHMAQNAEEMAAVDDLVPRLLDMQLRAL